MGLVHPFVYSWRSVCSWDSCVRRGEEQTIIAISLLEQCTSWVYLTLCACVVFTPWVPAWFLKCFLKQELLPWFWSVSVNGSSRSFLVFFLCYFFAFSFPHPPINTLPHLPFPFQQQWWSARSYLEVWGPGTALLFISSAALSVKETFSPECSISLPLITHHRGGGWSLYG